jgi:hypothetical protein
MTKIQATHFSRFSCRQSPSWLGFAGCSSIGRTSIRLQLFSGDCQYLIVFETIVADHIAQDPFENDIDFQFSLDEASMRGIDGPSEQCHLYGNS